MKAFFLTAGLLAALALLLVALLSRLELEHRLDAFLPAPADDDAELVVDQLGDNAAGRMILAALGGAEAHRLTAAADTIAAAWLDIPGMVAVHYGEPDLEHSDLSWLIDRQLLLTPDPAAHLSPAALNAALAERLADLALAGPGSETLVRRDPLGLLFELLPRLFPADYAHTFDGVWFDQAQGRVLLMAVTDVPGFDPRAQRDIVDAMRATAARYTDDDLTLTLTGPAVFSTDIDRAARGDAVRLTALACLWLLLLLLLAWRRPVMILAGAVPLLAGVCAGLAAVALGYPAVHGLTLAFGFTLLGITLDYPVHLFSHRHDAGAIGLPLGLSAASSLIAFAAIWLSASPGLAQLGAFSAVGLLAATAVTLLLLPRLRLPAPPAPPPFIGRLNDVRGAPWLPPLVLLSAVAGLAVMHDRLWSDDLRRLSPVDPAQLQTDRELRQALRAPEARELLVITGRQLETVLQATETAAADLEQARELGLIEDWQAVTALVPSAAAQAARRAAWPRPAALAERLEAAGTSLGFRASAFRPFIDTVERLPQQPDIVPETWSGTPLAARVDALLQATADGWRALILPIGIADRRAFAQWLDARDGPAHLVDLVDLSHTMAADYRRQVLLSLGVALGLVILLVSVRLRRPAQAFRTLVPPLAAVAASALLMRLTGDGLTVVHLIALILVAGIGLDYALFAQRFAGRGAQARATLWSLILCAASTGGVFLILGQSSIAMLAQLGQTAALGIGLCWLLVWLGSRQ